MCKIILFTKIRAKAKIAELFTAPGRTCQQLFKKEVNTSKTKSFG